MLPGDKTIPEAELVVHCSEDDEPGSGLVREYCAASAQICVPIAGVI